jgi:hypothetical protein
MIVSSPVDAQQTDVSTDADIEQMIAIAAYYIAERRGFVPGHDLEDWLAAEEQVHESLLLPN